MSRFGNTEVHYANGRVYWRDADMRGAHWQRTPFADTEFPSVHHAALAAHEWRAKMFAPTDLEERAAKAASESGA